MPTTAISYTSENLLIKAQQLADELNLPLVAINNLIFDYLLVYTPSHLELRPTKGKFSPLFIDLLSGKAAYRQQHRKIKNELIAKAIGIKKNIKPCVIDVTAGLGRDSFILANFGCHVLMLERSNIFFALLKDALERVAINNSSTNFPLDLIYTDAKTFLLQLPSSQYPDVIYCDPMYPERKKSALVKKEMRILREILGDDEDADELLAVALTKAKNRVVVKRPRLAGYLSDIKADYSFTGKSTRFDVYMTKLKINADG